MSHIPELIAITLAAAVVNGALGYGFSSITVPLALFLVANRVLNPALVVVEVALNGYALWVNRDALRDTWRRMLPIVIGLVPGIAAGTIAVAYVAPAWLKLWTFALLLPLILLQAAGLRRPIRSERRWGIPVGAGIGGLYALTTISGPPLALLLNNQGLGKREFRAGLAFVRLGESTITAVAYAAAGLFTREALILVPAVVPSLLVGVPVGVWLIARVNGEAFRRVCMSFDAWILAFGIATLLRALHIVDGASAYGVSVAVAVVDIALLCRFFGGRRVRPVAYSGPVPQESHP